MHTIKSCFLLLTILCSLILAHGVAAETNAFNVTIKMTPAKAGVDPWQYSLSRNLQRIRTLDTVYKGQKYKAKVFFQNYNIGADGQIDLTYDLRIKDPLGNVYFEHKDIPGMRASIEDSRMPILASKIVTIVHDPEDRLGQYTYEVTAHDKKSGSSVISSATIRLEEFDMDQGLQNEEEYHKWLQTYYIDPNPAIILPAYLNQAKMDFNSAFGSSEKKGVFIIETTFFKTLFEDNEWLAAKLAGAYDAASLHQKKKIIFMLQLLGYGGDSFFSQLENDMQAFAARFASFRLVEPLGVPSEPEQIDMLWAQFFATGNIEPVRKIINALNYAEYRNLPSRYNLENVPSSERENLIKGYIFQAAEWSLRSNSKQHSLIAQYTEYLFLSRELSLVQELWVGSILAATGDARYSEYSLPESERVLPETL